MQTPTAYTYSHATSPPTQPKYTAVRTSSSAFSASANPNEDWTKISDLAERRRIQNRIAQRNYRKPMRLGALPPSPSMANARTKEADPREGKKIKKRLEDLERRAGSSSASPEQVHAELPSPSQSRQNGDQGVKRRKSKGDQQMRNREPSPPSPPSHYSTYEDDQPAHFPWQYSRDFSTSPPPFDSYSYSLTEPDNHAPCPPQAPASGYVGQPLYLPSLPASLPSMSPYEYAPAKGDGRFDDDDMLGHYHMGYSSLASVDMANADVNFPDFHYRLP